MMDWLNQNAGAVQAIAAMAIFLATAVLVWATVRYAQIAERTRQVLVEDVKARTLVEVYPQLVIIDEQSSKQLALQVINLSSTGIWLHKIEFKVGQSGTIEAAATMAHRAELLVPAFEGRNISIQRPVWDAAGGGQGPGVDARVRARVQYRALGETRHSEWTQADVRMQRGNIGSYTMIPYCIEIIPA